MASATAPQNMEEFQGGHTGSDDVSALKDLLLSAQQNLSALNPTHAKGHAAMQSAANPNSEAVGCMSAVNPNLHGESMESHAWNSFLAVNSSVVTPQTNANQEGNMTKAESVANRSVWDRLKFGNRHNVGENPSAASRVSSYASIVQGNSNKNLGSLDFFPEVQETTNINIPVELLEKASSLYRDTLYGYFLGPRLYFPTVKKVVQNLWGKLGLQDVMMNDNGFIFFKFNQAEGLRQVLEGGPWMIRGVPLFVFPWDPQQGLIKPEHKTCPLWVKIHNIPLVAFNKEGVGRIASALGIPKIMDEHTTKMCNEAWGRPSFAKVLIEVNALGELKRELQVAIPNIFGGKEVIVPLTVEYIWEPSQCKHCMVFGHKTTRCPKDVTLSKKDKGKKIETTDNEGFTTVINRKRNAAKPAQQVWKPRDRGVFRLRRKENLQHWRLLLRKLCLIRQKKFLLRRIFIMSTVGRCQKMLM